MTIEELIDYIKCRKFTESDYFDVGRDAEEAYNKVNDCINECIRLVRDFQKENSRPDNRFAIIQKLLKDLIADAPNDSDLAKADRYDLIEMYSDVQNLIETMEFVDENESCIRKQKGLTRFDMFNCKRQVVVTDDWYPCVDGNKVDLSLNFFCYPSDYKDYGDYYVKLCAWGLDDTGVEIEESLWDFSSAIKKYNELLELYNSIPNGVDREWFYKNGFKNA